jgi:thioredoxin reductase
VFSWAKGSAPAMTMPAASKSMRINRPAWRGLYAIGDIVSDLHQIAVATGHAAAATHLHNDLPRSFR